MSGIVPPNLVFSPRSRLKPGTLRVIHSFAGWSLAIGVWDTNKALLIRWDGDPDRPLGNPVSRGYPTWFVLPEELHEAALEKVPDSAKRAEAASWLG